MGKACPAIAFKPKLQHLLLAEQGRGQAIPPVLGETLGKRCTGQAVMAIDVPRTQAVVELQSAAAGQTRKTSQ